MQLLTGAVLWIIGTQSQELGITNLHNDPILITKHRSCKIQIGVIKIIHPINLTELETTIQILTNTVYDKITNPLTKIVKQKTNDMYKNFYQLRPTTPARRKRWDIIGTTWKWIAGNPDAQDLRIINNTLNNLIDENNSQYRINEQLNIRLHHLTEAINKIASISFTNQITLSEIDTLITILSIDTINKILTDIQDAIILSKTLTVNSKILSLREILTIKNLLEEQGIQVKIPDEAFNFVIPKIAVSQRTLLYIIQVPQLETKEADIIQINPLNYNSSTIKNIPTHLVKTNKQFFTTTHPNEYIQKSSYLQKFSDDCVIPLILGTKANCTTMSDHSTRAKLITDNSLLITNAKDDRLSSNCGPEDRNLTGNFLITISNCTVTFENSNYTVKSIWNQIHHSNTAFYNTPLVRNKEDVLNLAITDNRSIDNRKQLEHIALKQFNNDIHILSLFGGLAISTIITIIVVITIIHYRKSLYRLSQRINRRRNRGQKIEKSATIIEKVPGTSLLHPPEES